MNLWNLVRDGDLEAVQNALEKASRSDFDSAIQAAAQAPGDGLEITRAILEKGPQKFAIGAALGQAAAKGRTEIVRLLLEHEPKLDPRNGETVLHAAAAGGHAETVRVLLEAGHDPDTLETELRSTQGWEDGVSPLVSAIRGGHVEAVRALAQGGARLNFATKTYRSPLDMAEALCQAEIAAVLLEAGARPFDPTMLDLFGAAKLGSLDQALATVGETSPEKRQLALLEAVRQGHEPIARAIFEHELPPEAPGLALCAAANSGRVGLLAWLVDECAVPVDLKVSWKEWTALHAAAYGSSLEAMRFCLERGMRVDLKDHDELQPLHYAAQAKSPEAVAFLLEHGADPKARDEHGKNALFHAKKYHASTPEQQAQLAQVLELLQRKGVKTRSKASWLKSLKAKLAPHAREAHKPRTKSGEGEPRASRFGGRPWLAPDEAWPRTEAGDPMAFLLQLDLGALPFEAGGGLARVFMDLEKGFRASDMTILHTSAAEGALAEPPGGVRRLAARQSAGFQAPKTDLPGVDVLCGGVKVELDPNERELLHEVCLAGDKAGGWPHWIQDTEYLGDCDRLLLQVDTGGALDFSYADSGIGFLLQSSADRSRFAMVWQTL
jgi:ankyrin repeat protein